MLDPEPYLDGTRTLEQVRAELPGLSRDDLKEAKARAEERLGDLEADDVRPGDSVDGIVRGDATVRGSMHERLERLRALVVALDAESTSRPQIADAPTE